MNSWNLANFSWIVNSQTKTKILESELKRMKNVKLFSRVVIITLLFIIFGVCLVLGKQASVYNSKQSETTSVSTSVSKQLPDYGEADGIVFDIIIAATESTQTTTETSTTTTTEETTTTTTTSTTSETTTSARHKTTTSTGANKVQPAPISTTTTAAKKVYIVYKPSTHYIHKSTCRWFDKTCKEITSTEGLECRRCSECKPELEIVKEYIPPVKQETKTEISTGYAGVTASEIILLQKLVANEYGADWVSVKEKAKIVASVMNQVKDKRFPNTVTKCIYKSCVPFGFNPNKKRTISDSVKKAVQYYFDNRNTVFKNWTANSWYGDGKYNHFYRA